LTSSFIQGIEASYKAGELEELKCSMLPFLLKHKKELLKFIDTFEKANNIQPLEVIVKYFILSFNMPFNMKFAMDNQMKLITKEIGPKIEDGSKRQKLVSSWIKDKAANYRSHLILLQIICFDKMKVHLLPEIEKVLGFST
jgi:hypothetical protein